MVKEIGPFPTTTSVTVNVSADAGSALSAKTTVVVRAAASGRNRVMINLSEGVSLKRSRQAV
jgi:hypothetical protein